MAYLDQPLTGYDPIQFDQVSESQIGDRFATVGYGVNNNSRSSGERRAGSLALRTLGGNVYGIIFGGFEGFRDWLMETNFFARSVLNGRM